MKDRDFNLRVEEIALNSPGTGAVPELYRRVFSLPYEFNGARILDLCSGMSVFSEWVYRQGGIPTAVDVNYVDFERLITNFTNTYEQVMQEDQKHTDLPTLQRNYSVRLQAFAQSLDSHPSIYVGASATRLPFKDNAFDQVVSLNGLFGTLDVDLDVLRASLGEAVRVVKVGGALKLAPATRFHSLSPDETRNQNRVISELDKNPAIKISRSTVSIEARNYRTVTITKLA